MNLKDHFIHKLSGMYCFADTPDLCDRLLQAGARIIQLREKKLDDQRFYELGRAMLDRVRRFEGAVLIVNDRVDVALRLEAHGIHIGQEDEHYRRVIQKAPPSMIVGVSVDNAEQAGIAEKRRRGLSGRRRGLFHGDQGGCSGDRNRRSAKHREFSQNSGGRHRRNHSEEPAPGH
jgi:Thiamine monophosphate synthase